MTRARKGWLALGIGVLLLAGAGLLAFSFLPSDEELAAKLSAKLKAALGVDVSIKALHWHVVPIPFVALEDVVVAQKQAIVLRRVALYPDLGALWQRRIRFKRVEVQGATLPQLSLSGLGKNLSGDAAKASFVEALGGFALDGLPLERLVFSDVTWISRRGIGVMYEGDVDFDAAWRPRMASMRRPTIKPATDIFLARLGQDDRWSVRSNVGGGTLNGNLQLKALASGRLHLDGQLQPRNIEVAQALEAFNRRPALAGKASGSTTLSAEGATAFELAQSLHTVTQFSMGRSTLLRFDLDKAIKTVGKDHAGQTLLDGITGQLDTQNTQDGMVTRFNNIAAKSGILSASGNARLFDQQVEADLAVDLVDGLVGVPLKISGPVNKVQVSVPGGTVAGAAIGTAVLPGIGTVIGARIGATVGKIFGADSGVDKKKSSVPQAGPGGEAVRQKGPRSQRAP